jgi:prevent-host-death family protein
MKSIGVRALRQRASEYLRLVEAGATLEVTARGRPVALLVPVRDTGQRERLVARGRVIPGAGDLLELGPPLKPSSDVPLPSVQLRRARAGER